MVYVCCLFSRKLCMILDLSVSPRHVDSVPVKPVADLQIIGVRKTG